MFADSELVEQLLLHLPNYVFWKDSNSIYLGCNHNFASLIGLTSPHDIIGYTDDRIYSLQEDALISRTEDQKIVATGESITNKKVTLSFTNNEKRTYLANKKLIRSYKSNSSIILCTLIDLAKDMPSDHTSEHCFKAPPHLDPVFNSLEAVITAMPCNVYWLDKECILRGGNRNLAAMFNLNSAAELAGLTYDQMEELGQWTEGQGKIFKAAEIEIINTGNSQFNIDEPSLMVNGFRRYYMSNKVPFYNKEKEIVGVIGISVDITSMKLAELILRESKEIAEAMVDSQKEFIATMSHDIRIPLAGISVIASMIARDIDIPSKQEAAQSIMKANNALLELLNDIIKNSKNSFNSNNSIIKFEIKKLVNYIEMLLMPLSKSKNIELNFHYDTDIPQYLIGDKLRIYRILLNLISNSIKFTNIGQVDVSIETENISNKEIILKIIVSDTGSGIPVNEQQKILSEPTSISTVFSEMNGDHGLGFFIIKKFISDLKGQLDIKTKADKGSTFICTIPLQKVPVIYQDENIFDNPHKDSSPTSIDYRYKVLAIEDSHLAQLAIVHQLEELNCSATLAHNGVQAIEYIEKNDYDIVITDINLPDKHGIELIKEVRKHDREHNKKTLVIVLTADISFAESHVEIGADKIFIKPLNLDEMKAFLAQQAISFDK